MARQDGLGQAEIGKQRLGFRFHVSRSVVDGQGWGGHGGGGQDEGVVIVGRSVRNDRV